MPLKNKDAGSRAWPSRELAQALLPLARKIRLSYWLETVRLVLTWGLAAAACVHMLLRLYPFASSLAVVYTGLGAGLAVVVTRIVKRPGALAVVRAADALGLGGTAVTAYRLLQGRTLESWAREAVKESLQECTAHCVKIAEAYPLAARKRPWVHVLLLAAVLGVSHFVPASLAPYWEQKQAEREALELASQKVQEALEPVQELAGDKDLLPAELRKELADLPAQVKKSGGLQEAADRLEKARWQLEEARAGVDPTEIQDLQRLQKVWQGMNGEQWQEIRNALENKDASQVRASVEELFNSPGKKDSVWQQKTAAALFQGAGAVKDQSLRSALKEAAAAVMDNLEKKSGQGKEQPLADAADALARELAGAVNSANAAGNLGQSSAMLGKLAAAMGSASSPAGAVSAMAGSGLGAMGAAEGEQETVLGAGGSGQGSSRRPASGDSGGSSQGGDNGAGDGSGTGSGGPGTGGSGAGKMGSTSELVFTPFLEDDGGENLQLPGQVRRGEQGIQVSMPNSPTALGAVRPLREVYGQYMAEAHESLSRDPLPRDMEKLVWQYFSSLQDGNKVKE